MRNKPRNRFNIYKDSAGQFRWTLIASNGRILADSGEGYKRKSNAMKAIRATQKPFMFSW